LHTTRIISNNSMFGRNVRTPLLNVINIIVRLRSGMFSRWKLIMFLILWSITKVLIRRNFTIRMYKIICSKHWGINMNVFCVPNCENTIQEGIWYLSQIYDQWIVIVNNKVVELMLKFNGPSFYHPSIVVLDIFCWTKWNKIWR